MSVKHHSFWHYGEFPQCSLCGGFLEEEWIKDYLAQAQLPLQKKSQKSDPHRDPGSVQQLHPENQVTDIAKSNNMSPGALCGKWS